MRQTIVAVLCGCILIALSATANAADDKRAQIVTGEAPSQTNSMDEWIEKTKHPTDWWSWGADLRLRWIYFNNAVLTKEDRPAHERNFGRFRARWWSNFQISEQMEANLKLTWESRLYDKPLAFEDWYDGPVYFDHFNVKLKKLADKDITLTIGRQDIILGNGWLVLDGTPLDGSRTIYFDAVRLNWQDLAEDFSMDFIYIDQAGDNDRWIPAFNGPYADQEEQIEQDERGVILWGKYTGYEKVELNPYYIYKHMQALEGVQRVNVGAPFNSYGDDGNLHTFGMRAVYTPSEKWSWRIEGAGQFGRKNSTNPAATAGPDQLAWGVVTRLTYFFKDGWDTQVRLNGEFLSGDNPDTDTDEEFDPLWGRWPQFSELYVYTYAPETRIGEVTNLGRLGIGCTTHPTEQIELCVDYNMLWADENTRAGAAVGGVPTFSQGGDFRGHLFSGIMRYKINKHVYGHVIGELLAPGNYYADEHRDMASFVRGEVVLAW